MANISSDITNYQDQIDSANKQAAGIMDTLRKSPTALGGNQPPSSSDIANQNRLDSLKKQINTLTGNKITAQWYPPKDPNASAPNAGEGQPTSGVMGTLLDVLQRPLYGVAGVVKHFAGQGTGNLQQDVSSNILKDKNEFGDILKKTGLPYWASAPIGFGLDIALDPITWMTAGTESLIPRLGYGLTKGAVKGGAEGAVKGLALAAKSRALESVTNASRYVPFINRVRKIVPAVEEAGKVLGTSEKVGSFFKRSLDALDSKSLAATAGWEEFAGKSVDDLLGAGTGKYQAGINSIFSSAMKVVPGAEKFKEYFSYKPSEWLKNAKILSVLTDNFGRGADIKAAVKAAQAGESTLPYAVKEVEAITKRSEAMKPVVETIKEIKETANKLKSAPIGATDAELNSGLDKLSSMQKEKVSGVAPRLTEGADASEELLRNPSLGGTNDPLENGKRILDDPMENALSILNKSDVSGSTITLDDVEKIVKQGALGDTGVEWFDKLSKSIRDFKITIKRPGSQEKIYNVGKTIVDKYDQAMAIFVVSKVSASPVSWVNAVVGNLLMHHMAEGEISPEFLGRVKQAWNFYLGKNGSAAVLDSVAGDILSDLRKSNRVAFDASFGFAAKNIKGTKDAVERIMRDALHGGAITKEQRIEAEAKIADILKKIVAGENPEDAIKKILSSVDPKDASKLKGAQEGGLDYAKIIAEKKGALQGEAGAGYGQSFLFDSDAKRRMFDTIAKNAAADPKDPAWKALDYVFNKMPAGFENIDQSYKLASLINSTVDGLSKKALMNVSKLMKIAPEDVTKIAGQNGQWKYLLSNEKALELANVKFMNYAAMPAAVKIFKNIPILRSPFISFMYAMAVKTAQTVAYNPAALNKVSFALKAYSGQKSPLEKKALQGQFYSYLDKPGMFRVPSVNEIFDSNFFNENPVYLNLANMIPYYSFNMFNSPQTRFVEDTLPTKLVTAVQQSPLLKDPLGSVLFDYFIQPLILGEAIAPQGQFGQAIYPYGASAGTKALYGMRTLGEAFTPNILGPLGVVTPEALAPYLPSYKWRGLTNAMNQKNVLGKPVTESWESLAARNLAGQFGIPVQAKINMKYVQQDNNQ